MLVLLALAAGLPLRCGSWRAEYGHPYIGTQESRADDGDDGEHSRIAEEPGSPQPVQYREDGRTRWGPAAHSRHSQQHACCCGSTPFLYLVRAFPPLLTAWQLLLLYPWQSVAR